MCDITDMYGTTCFYSGQALTCVSMKIIPLRTSGKYFCQENIIYCICSVALSIHVYFKGLFMHIYIYI